MAIVLTGGNQVFNAGIIKLLKRARNFKCISSERAGKKKTPPRAAAFLFSSWVRYSRFPLSARIQEAKKKKKKASESETRAVKPQN